MSPRFVRSALLATAVLCAALACSGKPPPAYDTPPVLDNRDEITAAMRAIGAGLEARVVLQLRVNEQGYVTDVDVSRSSGNEELDEAALWIAEQMRFRPAQHQGRTVPALVEVPITFDVVRHVVHAPRIRNARQVEAIIARDYPDLRGTARFRILIGREGWVKDVRDRGPSDEEVLRAARELLEDRIRFWPANKGGGPVPGWLNLTIEFAGEVSRVYADSEQT